jgi:selenide,water dikinase
MNDVSRRLTEFSHCAGCAAKIRKADLSLVLGRLKTRKDPRVLVGFGTHDDAAVYRLSATQAVVSTVDFFPPVVDDPYAFGQIAAANALSDIWAMGARPILALNLVAFPIKELGVGVLEAILRGGQSKADEAGIPVLGGHSIDDPEPKYGMAVTGVIHPRRILTNAGGRVGDVLFLTKPIGSGIATTAIKRGVASADLTGRVIALMSELNRKAGEVFASRRFAVHALTDVTGFGLLGHLTEVVLAARVRARLHLSQIPILAGVPALAAAGVVPGGTVSNLEHFGAEVRFPPELPRDVRLVLADAQTNGGLLAAVPARDASRAERALARAGVEAAMIGELVRGRPGIDVVESPASGQRPGRGIASTPG